MNRFTITCFCKKSNVKFRSPAGYSAAIIARLYCPSCSDRAPEEALFVEVNGISKKNGLYAIDWNQGILKDMEPDFHNQELWYRHFFGKKKLIFDFIPPQNGHTKKFLYEIIGIKEEVNFTELPENKRLV